MCIFYHEKMYTEVYKYETLHLMNKVSVVDRHFLSLKDL